METREEPTGGVSLAWLAVEDWERQQRRAALVAQVRRRQGNKGSRVWGFQVPKGFRAKRHGGK